MTDHNDGNNGEAGGSDMRCILTAAWIDKRQARPPEDHLKILLEEAFPNHPYPIRHKLKDYGMMWNFMASWSLTWGVELDEGLDASDTTPFLEENVVMTVYWGCPYRGGTTCLT
jgi:hypothetical protein